MAGLGLARARSSAAAAWMAPSHPSYEEYLDSKTTLTDLYYMGSRELARAQKELRQYLDTDVMSREEYDRVNTAADARAKSEAERAQRPGHAQLASFGQDLEDPLLRRLAGLEQEVRAGTKSVLVFMRCTNRRGHEVSGYIDYLDRLQRGHFTAIFSGKAPLEPLRSDLSFYNWSTRFDASSPSLSFEILPETPTLRFRCKLDRKVLHVDPDASSAGDNTVRCAIDASPHYFQAAIFVHTNRRRKQ